MLTLRALGLCSALILSSLALAAPAAACKCAPHPTAEALAQADSVFEGRVTLIEDVPAANQPSAPGKRVTMSVVRVWKDLEDVETVSVTTNAESAACGFPFEQGQSYLVYANRNEAAGLSVNSCSRTRKMADAAEDLATLGGGVTPVKVAPATPAADAGKNPVLSSARDTQASPETKSKSGCAVLPGPAAEPLGFALMSVLAGLFVWRRSSHALRRF